MAEERELNSGCPLDCLLWHMWRCFLIELTKVKENFSACLGGKVEGVVELLLCHVCYFAALLLYGISTVFCQLCLLSYPGFCQWLFWIIGYWIWQGFRTFGCFLEERWDLQDWSQWVVIGEKRSRPQPIVNWWYPIIYHSHWQIKQCCEYRILVPEGCEGLDEVQ